MSLPEPPSYCLPSRQNEHDASLHRACQILASEEIIRDLIESNPKAAQSHFQRNGLPLHEACRKSHYFALSTIQLLIQAYPEALREQDGKGELPIHAACSSRYISRSIHRSLTDAVDCHLDTIRILLELYPEGASIPDHRGEFPLHHAIRSDLPPSFPVVREVLRHYPAAAAVSIENKNDSYQHHDDSSDESTSQANLALHLLCQRNADVLTTVQMMAAFPDAVRIMPTKGQHSHALPLHIACKAQASPEVVKVLLDAYPEAASIEDGDGMLPLDRVWNNAKKSADTMDLLNILLPANPDAAYGIRGKKMNDREIFQGPIPKSDEHRSLPPQNLVMFETSHGSSCDIAVDKQSEEPTESLRVVQCLPLVKLSVEEFIALAHWNGLDQRNEAGDFPLHLACKSSASDELIRRMVEEHPGAARARDCNGELPLHLALQNNLGLEAVQALLSANGSALRIPTSDGWLPFAHALCVSGRSSIGRGFVGREDQKQQCWGSDSDEILSSVEIGYTLLRECPDVLAPIKLSGLFVNDSTKTNAHDQEEDEEDCCDLQAPSNCVLYDPDRSVLEGERKVSESSTLNEALLPTFRGSFFGDHRHGGGGDYSDGYYSDDNDIVRKQSHKGRKLALSARQRAKSDGLATEEVLKGEKRFEDDDKKHEETTRVDQKTDTEENETGSTGKTSVDGAFIEHDCEDEDAANHDTKALETEISFSGADVPANNSGNDECGSADENSGLDSIMAVQEVNQQSTQIRETVEELCSALDGESTSVDVVLSLLISELIPSHMNLRETAQVLLDREEIMSCVSRSRYQLP